MPIIMVVARSKAKAGKERDLERAIRAAIGPTHAEEGCLKSKHIADLFSKLPALVEGAPDIRVFEPLAEGNPAKGLL